MTEKNEQYTDEQENTEKVHEETSEVEQDQEVETELTTDENIETDENAEDEAAVDEKDKEIQQLQRALDDKEEQYLRLYAEFENYKRRIQKEVETTKAYQSQRVLTDILPTLDNINRALEIKGEDDAFLSLQKGVQMVYDSLVKALEDNGLEAIATEGEAFDPNFHQAVMQDDDSNYESGQITTELQKGYKLKDRVLRPSMVKVNQ